MRLLSPDMGALDHAAAHARRYVLDGILPSAVIAVADTGGETRVLAYDVAGKSAPSLAEGIFELASISKAITGTGIALLVDKGTLKYTDRVVEYIPEFGLDEWRTRITIGDIFTHTTGLPRLPTEQADDPRFGPTDNYRLTFDVDLLFEPGTYMLYNTIPYQLLNEIVYRVTGTRMPAFLREFVFEPSGMRDTGFAPVDESRTMPVALTVDPPEFTERLRYSGEAELSGAGMWSTANDLVNLGRALLQPGELMAADTFRAMSEPHEHPQWNTDKRSRRTWGWVKEDQAFFPHQPASGLYHGGATGTLLWLDPDRRFIFVFLTNLLCSCNDQAFATLEFFYR